MFPFQPIVLNPEKVNARNLERYRLGLNAEALRTRCALINAIWQGKDSVSLEPMRLRLAVLDRKMEVVDRITAKAEG